MECMELCLGMGQEPAESSWVKISRQTNMGAVVLGICYRLPDQEEVVDEAFFKQLEEASHLQALALMGNFNHPDIYWKDNTAGLEQSRRFLKCTDDNFLTQVIEGPTRKGALLDLTLTNKEELVGDVKAGVSLGCSDHEMVEFRILRGRSREKSMTQGLDFRRAGFGLFRDLLARIPGDTTLERREVQESCLIFKNHLLQI
ncbi:hypothetical protein GRJ2_003214800 [Grus japonensis]|uniref:Uncharacterized protein n=1 Tax=Grus japonensis TaxID=30415 RepID=A0ABC9YC29_GRUJA